jgi:hypothetical protein
MNQYTKNEDEKVKEYIKRAKKILGIELEGDSKTPENLLKMTDLIIETAKMLQIEKIEWERTIRKI